MPRDDAASRNVTDLRRSRQHAREVMRNIQREVEAFLEQRGVQIWNQDFSTPRDRARKLNEEITRIAARQMRQDLVQWLEERRKMTMARAARASFEHMRGALPGTNREIHFVSSPNLVASDYRLNAELKNIDAGMLYNSRGSLADELGNRATRQIRIGFSKNETVPEIAQRVREVLLDADSDTRREHGISGQTAKTKAELIAHDSVQDGYVSAAHKRYLNNGFRWAIYDAVIDLKTSTICRRLDEVVVDLVETPWLVPPNHPWCRSDIRPLLELDGREPITEESIGEDHLNTIWSTNGFRPKAMDTSREFNPTILNELLTSAGT